MLLDEIYNLIELPFDWLIDDAMFVFLLDELILGFCYSDLIWETGGCELASTITLVLQASPPFPKKKPKISTLLSSYPEQSDFGRSPTLLQYNGRVYVYN